MKVQELINELSKLNPELEIVGYTEDEELSRHFRLFDITDISAVHVETSRDDQYRPLMKFGKSEVSHEIALLSITAEF